MSGNSENTKQSSSTNKPRLEFDNPIEDPAISVQVSHSTNDVKKSAATIVTNTQTTTTTNPESSELEQSHKYDAVDFENEKPTGKTGKLDHTLNSDYEVPRPVVVGAEYDVPRSSISNSPYKELGDCDASSEYKAPEQKKKKRSLFGKKSESKTSIALTDDSDHVYENKEPHKQLIKCPNVGDCVRIILWLIAIGVAVIALVISFVSIGISSSDKSCDCPSTSVDIGMLDTLYNCTTSTIYTCNITQQNTIGWPSCLTQQANLSTFSNGSYFQCSVTTNGEHRPITTSMVYEDTIITGASPSQSVQCLCSILVGNETVSVSSNAVCVLKATECSVALVKRMN